MAASSVSLRLSPAAGGRWRRGHDRRPHAAAGRRRQLGLAQVPVHVASDLSPAQVKAYRLADNRTAEETAGISSCCRSSLTGCSSSGSTSSLLGFDPAELAELLAARPWASPTPTWYPSRRSSRSAKPGDLWQLGPHRLLCGDTTKVEDVVRVMDGRRAALMVTDPPYLVDYDGGHHPDRTKGNGGKRGKRTTSTGMPISTASTQSPSMRLPLACAREHALTRAAGHLPVLRHDARRASSLPPGGQAGLLAHQVIIWQKSRAGAHPLRLHLGLRALPLWLGCRASGRSRVVHRPMRAPSGRSPRAIEDGARACIRRVKPVELIRRPIGYHTLPGEIIYEPFSGSGTAHHRSRDDGPGLLCHRALARPSAMWPSRAGSASRGKEAVRHG